MSGVFGAFGCFVILATIVVALYAKIRVLKMSSGLCIGF